MITQIHSFPIVDLPEIKFHNPLIPTMYPAYYIMPQTNQIVNVQQDWFNEVRFLRYFISKYMK